MVVWSAEKDQIILKGIFKFCDIKNSASLLEYLAQEIGEGCTPKAVSHRLSNIRKSGSAASTPMASPHKGAIHKTPVSRVTPKGRKKKSIEDLDSPERLVDDNKALQSPCAARGKRNRNGVKTPSYAESVSDGESDQGRSRKLIKTELLDEDDDSSNYNSGHSVPDEDAEI